MREWTTPGMIHCWMRPKTMLVPTITSRARRIRKLKMAMMDFRERYEMICIELGPFSTVGRPVLLFHLSIVIKTHNFLVLCILGKLSS
jgi:hypothetical protein